ncbi:MAG TPA: phospho-sugar mutase [Bacteroidales bacterium]|nr:phospho-sugar mutase [Bacteroidales bacterium]HPB25463.1 phospho-sugar mutase [Bacteroidales bacterium]HPI29592.1 phospho-sugar mutase [Bacteroidales bacterium]HQN16177.1 phospho-sugar mutase [Bacteroidales bacterium]
MENPNIDTKILSKARQWLGVDYDEETRRQVQQMIDENPGELIESFYTNLEFGTGGLRGIMGVGTNRMNKYTVGMATQGLANYLKKMFPGNRQIRVAVAFDSRNNSKYFAQITAEILSANDIQVFLFEDLRPTPELSFTVRHLACQSGIVITASHNPKEYNGYKVYWEDGGQLVNPHDKNVIEEVLKVTSAGMVKFNSKPENISIIGSDVDDVYLAEVGKLSLIPEIIKKHKDLPVVYTPLHGTGIQLVPKAMKIFGFENIHVLEAQAIPDGNFPTIKSPNPEEQAALSMAIEKAKETGAELVLATDPDADRVGIAVKNNKGEFVLLNGNQTGSLLIFYLLSQWKNFGRLTGNEFIVKTIVTSELLSEIARKFDVECFDVLTGFKYIAEIIKKYEHKKRFIGGGEESYGYLVSDFVRDKDAVISCCMIAEAAVFAKEQGLSLFDLLIGIYHEFGFYYESLLSVTKQGKSGSEEIKKMMEKFRNNPPKSINNSEVVMIKDYLLQQQYGISANEIIPIDLPKSDVLQFFTSDGSKITVRPSGTEPKIKFYFGIIAELPDGAHYEEAEQKCKGKIDNIKAGLGL